MKKLLFLLTVLVIASVSCIRQEFDLNNDLDTNIRFGGDVMHIPIGTTDSLFLGDFLDADAIDILDTLNGGYAIIVTETLNVEVDGIEGFTFTVAPLSVEIDSGFYLHIDAVNIINNLLLLPIFPYDEITLEQLNYEATRADSELFIALGAHRNRFPLPLFAVIDTTIRIDMTETLENDQITDVEIVRFQEGSGFEVVIQPKNVPDGIGLRLDTLYLVFPNSVHLDLTGDSVLSSHVFMIRHMDIPAGGKTITVPIASMTVDYDGQAVTFSDQISVLARYSLTGAYTGPFFPYNEEYSTRLDLNVTSILNVKSATVVVDFDNDISVDLSGLPDILVNNRENLILDVNPHLRLRIDGNLDASTTLYLEAYRGGDAATPIEIPLNLTPGENLLWIAGTNNAPNGYDFISANLRDLVLTIPDSIAIRMGDSRATFGFDIDYAVDMTAEFVVPLTFGPAFSIVIEDTFHLDAAIGEMISGNSIGLSVRALNDIPLNLSATVTPIDENNAPISGITVDPFTITAGMTMDDDPALLMLSDPNDRLQYMRGLVFRFEVTPGANATLRPDNFIQIRLNATIEGGVTVDLNNL